MQVLINLLVGFFFLPAFQTDFMRVFIYLYDSTFIDSASTKNCSWDQIDCIKDNVGEIGVIN